MKRVSYLVCYDRSKVRDTCNSLIAVGARIVNVCDGQHDYTIWFEHERAGDADFDVEIGQAARDLKDYVAKGVYWNDQYKAAHKALDTLTEAVDNPCLEAEGDETFADALVRYVVDTCVKTSASWREIHGMPPLGG